MASVEDTIQQELAEIEKQLEGYDGLVQRRAQLRAALDVMSGQVAIASGARPTRRRASSNGDRTERILALIASNPGQHGYSSIAEAIGVSAATATKSIKALESEGKVKAEGSRRALRLFPTAA